MRTSSVAFGVAALCAEEVTVGGGGHHSSSGHQAVPPPKMLLELRAELARVERPGAASPARPPYVTYVDGSIAAIVAHDCTAALRHLSDLFTSLAGATRVAADDVRGASRMRANRLAHGWTVALGQLRGEGLLRLSEAPPSHATRVLQGLSETYLCDRSNSRPSIIGPFALRANPALAAALSCHHNETVALLLAARCRSPCHPCRRPTPPWPP